MKHTPAVLVETGTGIWREARHARPGDRAEPIKGGKVFVMAASGSLEERV